MYGVGRWVSSGWEKKIITLIWDFLKSMHLNMSSVSYKLFSWEKLFSFQNHGYLTNKLGILIESDLDGCC